MTIGFINIYFMVALSRESQSLVKWQHMDTHPPKWIGKKHRTMSSVKHTIQPTWDVASMKSIGRIWYWVYSWSFVPVETRMSLFVVDLVISFNSRSIHQQNWTQRQRGTLQLIYLMMDLLLMWGNHTALCLAWDSCGIYGKRGNAPLFQKK